MKMIKQMRDSRFIIFLFRLLLGVLFIMAGVFKIIDPQSFAENISDYRILPSAMIHPTAVVLPWAEVIGGLAVLIGFPIRIASLLLLALLVVFDIAIASALIRGLEIRCGCFLQSAGGLLDIFSLLIDLFLTMAAALVFWSAYRRRESG